MTCTVIIHICCEVMLHTLAILPNFDFYLCLRVKFHKSLFWVPILAAGGPYWVPISQKNGSLSQSLGVPISFGVSALGLHEKNLGPHSMWEQGNVCLSFPKNKLLLFLLQPGQWCSDLLSGGEWCYSLPRNPRIWRCWVLHHQLLFKHT